MTLSVLLVEPYHTGSHAAWATGYAAHSRHRVELLTLPGRFWKWRMHGGAVTLARQFLDSGLRPDVVLASDMLDLTTFLALTRQRTAGLPALLYFHENQLAYPLQPIDPGWSDSRKHRAQARDQHYPFLNYTSALAADLVLWNSAFNRDSFLEALPAFLRRFPDYNDQENVECIREKSQILPLGLDLHSLEAGRPPSPQSGPPLLLWNHRWEYDKGPREFFAALDALTTQGLDFRVAILGQSFRIQPQEFLAARKRLGDRIVHFGYTKSRADYARWLWKADIVVSCARHEFFGASVAEAIFCGCWPILPRRLAYPELLPQDQHDACLYEEFAGLVDRLAWSSEHVETIRQRDLKSIVAHYDWHLMAPRYDQLLESIA